MSLNIKFIPKLSGILTHSGMAQRAATVETHAASVFGHVSTPIAAKVEKPLTKIVQDGLEFFVNPSTGNRIATSLEGLPPLKDGYVRIVHRTSQGCADGIMKTGLDFSKHGLLQSTSDAYSLEKDFWELMHNDFRGNSFGDTKVIMDLPIAEHKVYCRLGQGNKIVPSKYVTGIVKNYGAPGFEISKAELERIMACTKRNPYINVMETDLAKLKAEFKLPSWEDFVRQDANGSPSKTVVPIPAPNPDAKIDYSSLDCTEVF